MSQEVPVVVCPNCRSSPRRGARFCDQCGWSLAPGGAVASSDTDGRALLTPRDPGEEHGHDENRLGAEEAGEVGRELPEGADDAEPYGKPDGPGRSLREKVGGQFPDSRPLERQSLAIAGGPGCRHSQRQFQDGGFAGARLLAE